MIKFGLKLLENGMVVDNSEYQVRRIEIIPFPLCFKFIENNLKEHLSLYKNGIGLFLPFEKQPLIIFGIPYSGEKGMVVFNNQKDVDDYFMYNKSVKLDNVVLTDNDYKLIKNQLTTYSTYPYFSEIFIEVMIKLFYELMNVEYDLITTDKLNISNHIVLEDFNVTTGTDLKNSLLLNGVPVHILDTYFPCLKEMENRINRLLEVNSAASYRFEIRPEGIYLKELPSFSARRYYINQEVLKET